MRRKYLNMIDDDPALFDVPDEWVLSALRRARDGGAADLGLGALAADVDLSSRREWPRPRRLSPRTIDRRRTLRPKHAHR